MAELRVVGAGAGVVAWGAGWAQPASRESINIANALRIVCRDILASIAVLSS
jgi:hypothetical protein